MAVRALPLIGLWLLVAAAPSFAEIYKCKDADGKSVYQDSPCDAPAGAYVEQAPRRSTPATPGAPAVIRRSIAIPATATPGSIAQPQAGGLPQAITAPAPKPLPGPIGPPVSRHPTVETPESRQIEANQQAFVVAITYMNYRKCAALFPDIAARHGANFERWRSENAAAIAKFEASAEFKAMFAGPEELKRAGGQQTREKCDDFAASAFAPLPLDVAKTPEEAWQRLVAAFRAGDVEKAAACFAFVSRPQYRDGLRRIGPQGMREAAAGFGDFRMLPGTRGELAYAELIRKLPDGTRQSTQVTFAHDTRSGGWFIKSM